MNNYEYDDDKKYTSIKKRVPTLFPTPLERLKHLRGQHDQLDHAWNRGTGGGTISGDEYQAGIKVLDQQVADGEIDQETADKTRAVLRKKANDAYDALTAASLGMARIPRRQRTSAQLADMRANDIATAAQNMNLANRQFAPQSIISGLTDRVTGFINRLRGPARPRVDPKLVKYQADIQAAFAGKSYSEQMELIAAIANTFSYDKTFHPLQPKNFAELKALMEMYKPQSFSLDAPYEGDYERTANAQRNIENLIYDIQKNNPDPNPHLENVNGNIYYTGNVREALSDLSSIPEYQENSFESRLINPWASRDIVTAIGSNQSHTNDIVNVGGRKYFDGPNEVRYYGEYAWLKEYFGEDTEFLLHPELARLLERGNSSRDRYKPTWFVDDQVPESLVNFGRIDDFQLYNPDVISPFVQGLVADAGQKVQAYMAERHPPGSPVANRLQTMLGLDVQNPAHMDTLASLMSFAEIPGTNAEITIMEAGDSIISEITSINPDTGEKIYAKRRISKTDKGSLEIFNDGVQVKGIKGAGIGHALLAKQVLAAREVGRQTNTTVDIKTDAMSATQEGDRPQQNGLHTWPRVGYDVTVPPAIKKAFADLGFDVKDVRKTSQLFKLTNAAGKSASELWPGVVEQIMQEKGSINAEGRIRVTDITDSGIQSLLSYSEEKLKQKLLFSDQQRPRTPAHDVVEQFRQTLSASDRNDPRIASALNATESIISSPISPNSDFNDVVDTLIAGISSGNPAPTVRMNYIRNPVNLQNIPLTQFRGDHSSPQPATGTFFVEPTEPFTFYRGDAVLQSYNEFAQQYGTSNWSLDESLVSPELVSAINGQMANGRDVMATMASLLQQIENQNIVLRQIQDTYGQITRGVSEVPVGSPIRQFASKVSEILAAEFDRLVEKHMDLTDQFKIVNAKVNAYVTASRVNMTPEVTAFHDATLGKSVNPDMQTAPFSYEIVPEDDGVTADQIEQHKKVAEQVAAFMEKYVDKRLHPTATFIASADPTRAGYIEGGSNSENVVSVGSEMSSLANTLHEFFHGIELQNPKVRDLINGFWVSRLQGETVAYKQRGAVWMPDKFGDWYIGMGDGSGDKVSIEVLSMAASFFVADPVRFAREQPDYYRFIATLLSGKWMD